MDKWAIAEPPNYETNEDKLYPYSELPDLSKYKLIKIPYCINKLIEHVDYFGEGRISTDKGHLGFPDCYNVNWEYSLVSTGKNKGRKIPNRIPIPQEKHNRSDYYSSNYIKDNSVLTVTFAYINEEMSDEVAKDIARIVNGYSGKVMLYGYSINSDWYSNRILKISEELKKMKQLFYCPIYMLPDNLQLTHYKTCYRVYLNLNEFKKELYSNVKKGEYEAAIILTGCMTDVYCCNALSQVVTRLLKNKVRKVIDYAYKLWTDNAESIVRKYFPTVFKLMFNSDYIIIVNKEYNQALISFNVDDTLECCGSHDKTNSNAQCKINPVWNNNTIGFKLINVDSGFCLNIDDSVVFNDSTNTNMLYFDPLMIDGQVCFTITNIYKKQLKMTKTKSSYRVNNVIVNGGIPPDESCVWILAPWKQNIEINDYRPENGHNCINVINSI